MMMNDQSVSWAAMRRGKRLAKDKGFATLDTSAPFWHSLRMNFIVDTSDSGWKVVRYLNELQKADKQLIKDHLRTLQAPAGINPVLKCWMEVS